MSDLGNGRPSGWYHAEGDPAGTERFWDGAAWQGGPQAARGGAGAPGTMATASGGGGNDIGYKGFFPTLFDFSLTSFLAPKVIKVFFIIGVVLTCLGAALYFILALASGSAGLIVAALIFIPIFTVIYLIFIRIYAEVVIVLFRTNEEVRQLRQELQQQ